MHCAEGGRTPARVTEDCAADTKLRPLMVAAKRECWLAADFSRLLIQYRDAQNPWVKSSVRARQIFNRVCNFPLGINTDSRHWFLISDTCLSSSCRQQNEGRLPNLHLPPELKYAAVFAPHSVGGPNFHRPFVSKF